MSGDHSESPTFLTDDEEELVLAAITTRRSLQGVLSKWTNYIHGWQDRFMILKDGTLSYYKSQQDLSFGCRGSISILKANSQIRSHEFDECRFDVSVNDCVWYLRAESLEEKTKWVEALEQYKLESGYGSQNSLQRYGSAVSISSNTLSATSGSSFRTKGRGLKVKVAELETYRDILVQQIEKLQKYFDACATHSASDNLAGPFTNNYASGSEFLPAGLSSVDFRGEALTFKATTSGVLTSISHCIEVMSQREDVWRKRVEKEVEKRKQLEELFKQSLKEAQDATSKLTMIGPDCEEGPHSAMKEDEFYDAVELGLDRLEQEEAFRARLKEIEPVSSGLPPSSHPMNEEINRITLEQLHYARLPVGEGGWELFAEEGEMKMFKREEEINGLVVDPLKAVHTVKGFTGHEMCQLFFSPEVRMEWEMTLEQMTILETISSDTLVFLQIHKRVWPATQRDAVFWSHIRQVPDSDPAAPAVWIVCNHSTAHPSAPEKSNGKYIRLAMTVSLTCQTVINPPKNDAEITRDDITCKITYCSVINPGGWAPASVLRAVYKREYPRFLKKFTQYVHDKCKNKPIMF